MHETLTNFAAVFRQVACDTTPSHSNLAQAPAWQSSPILLALILMGPAGQLLSWIGLLVRRFCGWLEVPVLRLTTNRSDLTAGGWVFLGL